MPEVQTATPDDPSYGFTPAEVKRANPGGPPPPPITDLVGEPATMRPDIQAGLVKIKKDESEARERIYDATNERIERDRGRMEHAYEASAAGPGAMPPEWNADQEKAKRTTGLMEAFGSPAMVFATLASAFTRQPMINSLNAGAAALNAIHAGDQKSYDEAHAAWKENTDLALKRHNMEREAFQDAMSLMQTNLAAGRTQAEQVALKFQDQRALFLLRNGMDKEFMDYQNAQTINGLKIADASIKLQKSHDEMQLKRDIQEAAKSRDPAQIADIKNRISASDMDVKEQMWLQHVLEHPGESEAERLKAYHEIYPTVRQVPPQQIWLQNQIEEYKRTHDGQEPPPDVMRTLQASASAKTPPASDDAVERTARMIAEYRQAPLSGYAMRSPDGIRIMSKVRELNSDYRAEEYTKRNRAEVAFATGTQGNTVRSLNVIVDHLSTLDELSKALHGGNVQAINRAKQRFEQEFGQPAPVSFDAAKQVIGTELIKAITTAGGGVTERQEAQDHINRANSPAQIAGVIATYKKLLAGQLGGLRRQYKEATGRDDEDFDRMLSEDAKRELKGIGTKKEEPAAAAPTMPPGADKGGFSAVRVE